LYTLGGLRLGMSPEAVVAVKGRPDATHTLLGWIAWTWYKGSTLSAGFHQEQVFFIHGMHMLRYGNHIIAGPNIPSQRIFDHFGEADQAHMSATAMAQDMVHATFHRDGRVFYFSGEFTLGGLWTVGLVEESMWGRIPHFG
jgi:hypothetical protein